MTPYQPNAFPHQIGVPPDQSQPEAAASPAEPDPTPVPKPSPLSILPPAPTGQPAAPKRRSRRK